MRDHEQESMTALDAYDALVELVEFAVELPSSEKMGALLRTLGVQIRRALPDPDPEAPLSARVANDVDEEE